MINEDLGTLNQEAERIRQALERMSLDLPQLSEIFKAFGAICQSQAQIRDQLPEVDISRLTWITENLSQGIPALNRDALCIPDANFWEAAKKLIPIMASSFPKIKDQLTKIEQMVVQQTGSHQDLYESLMSEEDNPVKSELIREQIDLPIIRFVMAQVVNPFAWKVGGSFPALPESAQWHRGYCPVCGSWPDLSLIQDKEGKRTLQCSFCGYQWGYLRLSCPFCESDDQDKLEFLFSEDRKHERAELCLICKKYIVGIDSRESTINIPREVAGLSLIYLDLIAQQKGFSPGVANAWNKLEASGD
jgi:FdhE protein